MDEENNVVAQPVTTGPVATEPTATEPTATEPIVAEPVTAEPIATEPIVAEPVATEPVATDPIVAEPIVAESVTETYVATPVVEEPPKKKGFFRSNLVIICLVVILIAVVAWGLSTRNSKSPLAIFTEALTKTSQEANATLKVNSPNMVDATIKYELADTIDATTMDVLANVTMFGEMHAVLANGKMAYSAGMMDKKAMTLKDALGDGYASFEKSYSDGRKNKGKVDYKELATTLQDEAKKQGVKYADKINEKALTQAVDLLVSFDKSIAKDEKIFKNFSKTNDNSGTTYKFDLDTKVLADSCIAYVSTNYTKYPELKALLDAAAAENGQYKTFAEAIKASPADTTNAPTLGITFIINKNGFLGKTTIKYENTEVSFEFVDIGSTKIDKGAIDSFITECENYQPTPTYNPYFNPGY